MFFIIKGKNCSKKTKVIVSFPDVMWWHYFWKSLFARVYACSHTYEKLSVLLSVRCNAEQELLMHCMLLALAEVQGQQDQYY